jgi:indolepyruvate ferredoxin oxidoreductase, beta subunit
MTAPGRPVSVLIAALGGEGGGVLTSWIVAAAEHFGFPVQSTSIPGVAQRTGATTYYIEILPASRRELEGRTPVLALVPGVGDIDLMVSSELMEAARAVAAGFVTPSRTLTIASTSRFYVMNEKIAMGDGRYDSGRLMKAIEQHSQRHLLFDMEEIARRTGAIVNAVMLGAIAGSGRLPMPAEAFEGAIRADGKAVEANLRGFRAGLDAAQQANAARRDPEHRRRGPVASIADLEREIVSVMSAAARDVIQEGARRLVGYQNIAYAQIYIDRLAPIRLADEGAGTGGKLLRETGRHLAVRMSYEDVIRVAQAKIDPARRARIAAEVAAKPDEPLHITEFLKPGIDEFCSILPPWLACFILSVSEKRGWTDRVHWGMEVNTASITGYLRFWLLAKLKPWRPRSYRYQEEQRSIEAWLALIVEAAKISGELALEVAECVRLIKGYGDTHKRGTANYRLIEERVIRPALAGQFAPLQAVDALASARTAAMVDPDGESLANCLADIGRQMPRRIAAE